MVAIAGIGLRVVDLVVDGLNGGLEGSSIGLLSSINASSVSSSSTNSALKLKINKLLIIFSCQIATAWKIKSDVVALADSA